MAVQPATSEEAHVTVQLTLLLNQSRISVSSSRSLRHLGVLSHATSVALDSHGGLYVADSVQRQVQQRDAQGRWTVVVDAATQAQEFQCPSAVAVDQLDNLYVVDSDSRQVLKRNADGKWESCVLPFAPPGYSYEPADIAADGSDNLYLIEDGTPGGRLLRRDHQGDWTVLSDIGTDAKAIGAVRGVAASPNGNVYVCDQIKGKWRWRLRDSTGRWTPVISQDGSTYSIENTGGIATDSIGRLYLADSTFGRVLVRDVTGKWFVLTTRDSAGRDESLYGRYGMDRYVKIRVDRHDDLYVSVNYPARVLRWTPQSESKTATGVE